MRSSWRRLAMTVGWAAMSCTVALGGHSVEQAAKPIIAQLLRAPQDYSERMVAVYGLVIEIRAGGRIFSLQDVSQMPLKVVRKDGGHTAVGDQLLVVGVFKATARESFLDAHAITETKVLGGGGCC